MTKADILYIMLMISTMWGITIYYGQDIEKNEAIAKLEKDPVYMHCMERAKLSNEMANELERMINDQRREEETKQIGE